MAIHVKFTIEPMIIIVEVDQLAPALEALSALKAQISDFAILYENDEQKPVRKPAKKHRHRVKGKAHRRTPETIREILMDKIAELMKTDEPATVAALAKAGGMAYGVAKKNLARMEMMGFIERQTIGKRVSYLIA